MSDPPSSCAGVRPKSPWPLLLLLLAFASSALVAQYQKAPPDFGGSYSFPTPTHPELRSGIVLGIDVAMLAAGATPPAAATVITILHVNDTHSHLEAAEVAREALRIASEIDLYTNDHITVEVAP
jgi:2',3'-cyclic-nucleotide 2'-phosphodiesterase (5'-nucleotidase family)